MSEGLVLYRKEEKVAVVTLNRPHKLNALSRELWRDLDARMVEADDDPEVSAIALVANGQAFSAGADLTPGEDPVQMLSWWDAFERHHTRQFRMWDSKKLLVAGVHGTAWAAASNWRCGATLSWPRRTPGLASPRCARVGSCRAWCPG